MRYLCHVGKQNIRSAGHILLAQNSTIPIICAAIFLWVTIIYPITGNQNQCLSGVLAAPFLIGIIVGLVVQIEIRPGISALLGTIPSRTATYIGKLGFR